MSNLNGLMRSHNCGELNLSNVQESVTLCGWVNKNRDLGGLTFIDLRDKYGVTQISFTDYKGDLSVLKNCHLESVLKITGVVRARPLEAVNKNMSTGEVELMATELTILSPSDIHNIPFLPYGATTPTEDNKLKYRYLDLRTQKLQNILKLRSDTTLEIRKIMHAENFIEVETPILYKSTPEGARDYVVPSRVHPGHVYALPQSPQTLKQLLMIGGTDKYFQICKCFRDEDLRADRQPEFTQIDIEVSYPTQDYIKNLVTRILKQIFKLDSNFELPVMTYQEAMRDYGCDKPDIRFGLKQYIVNDLFKSTEFGVFANAISTGGIVKTMFVPESLGTLTRKFLDGLVEIVKPHGGKGVAFFKVEDSKISGGISKFVTEEVLAKLTAFEGGVQNGTWLFFADEAEVAHASADAVRRYLGRELNLLGDKKAFLWVNNFPLFEYKDGRFYACHHPFTQVREDQLNDFLKGDMHDPNGPLKDLCAQAYDIVCNGYEIGGGSLRIYNQEVQARMFEILGMSEAEVKHQFGFFVEALKYGTPPHGGLAFGLDRLIMILAGTDNIRDVIAFPKTATASDLMSSAPSAPSKAQTDELHFSFLSK